MSDVSLIKTSSFVVHEIMLVPDAILFPIT